jgi:hypothetical protein
MNKIECLGCKNKKPLYRDSVCSPECRRKVYEKLECCECRKEYRKGRANEEGWRVPGFKHYLDRTYACPDCLALIEKKVEEFERKQRMSEMILKLAECFVDEDDACFFSSALDIVLKQRTLSRDKDRKGDRDE